MSIVKEIYLKYREYNSILELPDDEYMLVKSALGSINNSYSPYSHFSVSAAVLLDNKEIITGTNQENSAYPSGMCAERTALFYANSKYPNIPVKAIAICAHDDKNNQTTEPVTPCGACRQVMLETEIRFNTPIKVIMVGKNRILVVENIKQLLPFHFSL